MTRIVKNAAAIAIIASTLLASADALALRCGSRLLKEGMYETEVIVLCGQPVVVRELGYVLRPYIVKVPASDMNSLATRRVYGGFHQELAVRELLFNFGPHKLMRVIRFEGGRLASIVTAGYGYRKKNRSLATKSHQYQP